MTERNRERQRPPERLGLKDLWLANRYLAALQDSPFMPFRPSLEATELDMKTVFSGVTPPKDTPSARFAHLRGEVEALMYQSPQAEITSLNDDLILAELKHQPGQLPAATDEELLAFTTKHNLPPFVGRAAVLSSTNTQAVIDVLERLKTDPRKSTDFRLDAVDTVISGIAPFVDEFRNLEVKENEIRELIHAEREKKEAEEGRETIKRRDFMRGALIWGARGLGVAAAGALVVGGYRWIDSAVNSPEAKAEKRDKEKRMTLQPGQPSDSSETGWSVEYLFPEDATYVADPRNSQYADGGEDITLKKDLDMINPKTDISLSSYRLVDGKETVQFRVTIIKSSDNNASYDQVEHKLLPLDQNNKIDGSTVVFREKTSGKQVVMRISKVSLVNEYRDKYNLTPLVKQ